MKQQANYYRIGVFTLCTIAVLILFLIFLGARDWFSQSLQAETYFNESVQGLEVGSPVKFRGVKVGQVEAIDMVNDVYGVGGLHANTSDMRYIYVRFSLSHSIHTTKQLSTPVPELLQKYVNQGLRVRLETSDLVGNVYLEMNFLNPQKNPMLPISWKPNTIYIPSAKSTLSRFTNNIDKLFSTLSTIEYKTVVEDFDHMVKEATTMLSTMNKQQFSQQLTDSLKYIGQLANTVNHMLTSQDSKQFIQVMQENATLLQTTLSNFNTGINTLNQLLSKTTELTQNQQANLINTLNNLQQASENLSAITTTVNNHPSSLLFSQPKPPLEPGK